MRAITRALVLAFMVFCARAVSAMTAEQWREDLDFLAAKLSTVHPAPFGKTSQNDFDAAVSALRADIPRLKDHEIAVRMMQITALLGDGHTGLDPGGEVAGFDHWFPVRIERFQEGWFITAATKAQQSLIGRQVLRVGTLSMEDAAKRIDATVNGDNAFTRLFYGGYVLAMPKALSALGINHDLEHLSLTLQGKGGKQEAVSISAIAKPFSLQWFFTGPGVVGDDSVSAPLVAPDQLAPVFSHAKDVYWYEYQPKTHTLYVNIHFIVNLKGLPAAWGFTAAAPTLAEFFRQMWSEFDRLKAERVVLDIRNNGGGNNQLLGPLVSGFEARPDLNRRGNVFVITGRRTYSAAMNLVALMEQRTDAIFVGEPAGGSPRHSGDATSFTLPHSGMNLNVSVFSWDLGADPWDVRDRVEPELVVPPRASAYFSGKDPALEAIDAYPATPTRVDRMMDIADHQGIDAALAFADEQRRSDAADPWNAAEYPLWMLADRLEWRAGKDADFMKTLRHATEQFPDSWRAWFRWGFASYQRHQWDDATQAFKRAQSLNPNSLLLPRLLAASSKS